MSRWCDQTIHDARHSVKPNGPLRGRGFVWNSRRGNHLGQHSCASAPTGRTYGRKRSGQNTAKHLARRGPSTYGLRAPLFAGSDEGAENWAMLASLIETSKLHRVNPQAYFTDVLTKLVNNWPNSRLAELLPWAWAAEAS